MDKIIIATIHPWNIKNARWLKAHRRGVVLVTDPKRLTPDFVRKHQPRYIFFPHWSWYISPEIFRSYECVVFHMTDLPYGRGGSPLQNLIVRGQYWTKISAIKVVEGIDAGPVYRKAMLRLSGTAEDILVRASEIVFKKMIPDILKGGVSPKPQQGKVVVFKRRKPQQGAIGNLKSEKKVYDHIRMLDAPGYPRAFLAFKHIVVNFSKARLAGKKVIAEAEIICRR
ncbi:MAG: methionyl-tRNA formyltransferase [Candidatus Omnitrophica bacterium]|nr:methionyl-tRNA formyltransferase [Candidatus Omnitrophota bacterium]